MLSCMSTLLSKLIYQIHYIVQFLLHVIDLLHINIMGLWEDDGVDLKIGLYKKCTIKFVEPRVGITVLESNDINN
ncbi:hypothetical protein L2E82_22313 [Cichorium intybus]|uniref:Uncharacterized protein n=1 Tax=Cichorium intybus TaxID=13427 RepID=A0ACB9DXT2_CICIN|nr:hypothetical protein L2E82_22313 [Cichorium intybus]